jgi:HEXXH motif-containing protein
MSNWVQQFSLPCAEPCESVFDTIVTSHGVAVANCLLERHADDIARASDGLVDFIRCWITSPPVAKTAWDIAFGRAHLALKEGRHDVAVALDAAVRVGLRLAAGGQSGRWSAQMAPATIQLDDRVIDAVEQIEVHVDEDRWDAGSRLCLRLADGSAHLWRRDGDQWAGEGGRRLASVGSTRPIYLLPRQALPADKNGSEIFQKCQPVEHISPLMAQSFEDGIAVLRQNVPDYLPWVERVLNGIVVCPVEDQYRLVSGSWEDVPGFVHMSSPHAGIDIAEILVHECAHQYFYMLQRVGALDDASDRALYWSPPIRKKRPLSRILMAYHALANVQLLYDAVRRNTANSPQDIRYVEINEPDLQAAIRALDAPLRDNPALTTLGRALYAPLAARLAALSP